MTAGISKLKLKNAAHRFNKDDFKLSKHTGPKREHDVRQFCMRARATAFRFKSETYVQYVTIGTDFPKLCKINLKTDQVVILHILTEIDISQHGIIYIENQSCIEMKDYP